MVENYTNIGIHILANIFDFKLFKDLKICKIELKVMIIWTKIMFGFELYCLYNILQYLLFSEKVLYKGKNMK